MDYELSQHAAEVIRRRNIRLEWLEAALRSPQQVQSDANDLDVVHHLRAIEENEGRVLRVLYNRTTSPIRIISVFFDRRKKGTL